MYHGWPLPSIPISDSSKERDTQKVDHGEGGFDVRDLGHERGLLLEQAVLKDLVFLEMK